MAKKKVIVKKKATPEVEVKKKDSKKKKVASKKITKEESEKTSKKIDELSLDEVADKIDAFDEEPSELEREVQASESEFDEEIAEERIYTIPLAKGFKKAKNWKRTKKAVKILREFIDRHMKPEAVYISQEVNERLWENGIRNPPRKIRVRVTKTVEGLVRVLLA